MVHEMPSLTNGIPCILQTLKMENGNWNVSFLCSLSLNFEHCTNYAEKFNKIINYMSSV